MGAGDNLTGRSNLSDDTVMGYVSAAAGYIQLEYGVPSPLHIPGQTSWDPFISGLLAARRTWAQPANSQKEPLSTAMIDALWAHVAPLDPILQTAAVADWILLGIFTGSRLQEYASSKRTPGDPWPRIPNTELVPPEWRGQPLGFIAADFTFLDRGKIVLTHGQALSAPAMVGALRIRFRYDKSKHNFSRRTFGTTSHAFLCPVKAGLSIIRRARKIGIPPDQPLGQYRMKGKTTTKNYMLLAEHIQKVMRDICILAHPDPNHYMRVNINRLSSHCLRVTACVMLHNGGVSLDDIKHRLRWNSDSVKLYLRDNCRFIHDATCRVIAGVYRGEDDDS